MNTDPHAAGRPEFDIGGPSGHASHDELLIARFTGDDVTPEEADRSRSLLATCPSCRLLAADLYAIARAMADIPAPVRTRDFRISEEQAARLRPGGLGGWLQRVAGFVRPEAAVAGRGRGRALQRLAGAAVAIGLVMAVVTSPAVAPLASPTSGGAFARAPALPASSAAAFSRGPGSSGGPASDQAPLLGQAGPVASAERATASAVPSPAAPPLFAGGPAVVSSAAPAAGTVPQPRASSPVPEKGATTATGNGGGVSAGEAPTGPAPAGVSPVGRQAAPGLTIEAWQAWLLLALAGLVAFAALRLAVRRTE